MPTGVYDRRKIPIIERFLAKIVKDKETGCWNWVGYVNKGGYGLISSDTRPLLSHRVSHTFYKGDIPKGFDIDHLCRNRSCCNPDHLEAVTRKENLKRGIGPQLASERSKAATHCPKGHEYTVENTRYRTQGWKLCRICSRANRRDYRAKLKKQSTMESKND